MLADMDRQPGPAGAAEVAPEPDAAPDRAGPDPELPRREASSASIAESRSSWPYAAGDDVCRPLGDAFASMEVSEDSAFWRKLSSYSGIGMVIGVGYMDPGNWATDIAGGASYEYQLLCVVLLASLMAMLFQYLALKLGVATSRDLAVACRHAFHPKIVLALWVIMELAIAATDLAEVLGSAIALHLLFGIPLLAGVLVTTVDVLLILAVQNSRFRYFEYLIIILTAVMSILLVILVIQANPFWPDVFAGFIPRKEIFSSPDELFVAVGIIGATIMPHNLFLHGALVQTRNFARSIQGRQLALKFASIDSFGSLFVAFFVNATLLVLAGAAFYPLNDPNIDITSAYALLSPLLGTSAASIMFGVALLASGQQASLTGTLAGQVVMEGMTSFQIAPWKRRFFTRIVALIPAVVVTAAYPSGTGNLLIISQVVLSIALSFATVPLVMFTSSEAKMGPHFVNSWCTTLAAWLAVVIIAGLNAYVVCSPSTWTLS